MADFACLYTPLLNADWSKVKKVPEYSQVLADWLKCKLVTFDWSVLEYIFAYWSDLNLNILRNEYMLEHGLNWHENI